MIKNTAAATMAPKSSRRRASMHELRRRTTTRFLVANAAADDTAWLTTMNQPPHTTTPQPRHCTILSRASQCHPSPSTNVLGLALPTGRSGRRCGIERAGISIAEVSAKTVQLEGTTSMTIPTRLSRRSSPAMASEHVSASGPPNGSIRRPPSRTISAHSGDSSTPAPAPMPVNRRQALLAGFQP